MTADRRMAVALRAVLARFFSDEEMRELLWELDLDDTVSANTTRDNLAHQAADSLVRHGKLEEAMRLAREKRPNIPQYLWSFIEESQPPVINKEPPTHVPVIMRGMLIDNGLQKEADTEWLTVAEAASLLSVHESTVRRWIADNRIDAKTTGYFRKDYRIARSTVNRLIESRK